MIFARPANGFRWKVSHTAASELVNLKQLSSWPQEAFQRLQAKLIMDGAKIGKREYSLGAGFFSYSMDFEEIKIAIVYQLKGDECILQSIKQWRT